MSNLSFKDAFFHYAKNEKLLTVFWAIKNVSYLYTLPGSKDFLKPSLALTINTEAHRTLYIYKRIDTKRKKQISMC